MSNQQNNQRLRRNGSPSTKPGPIRATQQFAWASPSRTQVRCSPTSSPAPKEGKTRSRPLSETGLLTGRRSPSSPCGFRIVEKPKPAITGRSNSFDNVMAAPYLSGQWPKDGQWQQQKDSNGYLLFNTSPFASDKQTQTPDEWEESCERRRSASRLNKSRSQSVGSGDQQLKNIKHKLQRNGGLPASTAAYQQRLSPVFHTGSCLQAVSSVPIKIPISTSTTSGPFTAPRGTPGKARGSVEGLNQEVEKLIISGRKLDATENLLVDRDRLDGHRAPVFELLTQTTRSVNTQTPSHIYNGGDSSSDALPIMLDIKDIGSERSSSQGSDDSSRGEDDDEGHSSLSDSPSSFIPGQFELEDSGPLEPNDEIEDFVTKMPASPRPNSEFMRQPPDGAEKIKIIDELPSVSKFAEFRHLAPSKTFQPSATSAFQYLPVYKRNLELSQTAVGNAH